MNDSPLLVGVLAVQGDFAEHIDALDRIGAASREVRLPADLDGIDALIIPGGESTAIARLIDLYALREPLVQLGRGRLPIWGTCAGAIMIAREARDLDRPTLDLMDITVRRNAFGRQVDSFEADLTVAAFGEPPVHAVFIRAPWIERAGAAVETLATLDDGTIVAAREGSLLATSFHPELTGDTRFHELLLRIAVEAREKRSGRA